MATGKSQAQLGVITHNSLLEKKLLSLSEELELKQSSLKLQDKLLTFEDVYFFFQKHAIEVGSHIIIDCALLDNIEIIAWAYLTTCLNSGKLQSVCLLNANEAILLKVDSLKLMTNHQDYEKIKVIHELGQIAELTH